MLGEGMSMTVVARKFHAGFLQKEIDREKRGGNLKELRIFHFAERYHHR